MERGGHLEEPLYSHSTRWISYLLNCNLKSEVTLYAITQKADFDRLITNCTAQGGMFSLSSSSG